MYVWINTLSQIVRRLLLSRNNDSSMQWVTGDYLQLGDLLWPQIFFTFPVCYALFHFPVGQITFTFELTKWHSPTFLPSKIPSSYTSPQSIICHFLSCHGWSGMTKWVKILSRVAFFCLDYIIWFFDFHMYFWMHKRQRPSKKSAAK